MIVNVHIVLHMNAVRQPNLRTDETRMEHGHRPPLEFVRLRSQALHGLTQHKRRTAVPCWQRFRGTDAGSGQKIGVSSFSQSEN